MITTTDRILHVANGDSTTATIHAAGIAGRSSIWADPLHAGPVPGNVPDDRLIDVRAQYLAEPDAASIAKASAELRRWREVIDAGGYEELVLWFEHDLFDQLNLVQLLSHLRAPRSDGRRVSLICIGAFPGRPHFKGLGELSPAELAPLFDTRQPVTDAQYALAERAWQAFRADDPRMIEALLATDTTALPFLGAALRRHLEEFPAAADGLSRSERRLIDLAREAPVDLHATFPLMQVGETAYYMTDDSLMTLVRELAGAEPALVQFDVDAATPPRQLPKGMVSLTAIGRAVLAGEMDRIAACGIDRWLGGVHLQGRGPLWRWDAARGALVHA